MVRKNLRTTCLMTIIILFLPQGVFNIMVPACWIIIGNSSFLFRFIMFYTGILPSHSSLIISYVVPWVVINLRQGKHHCRSVCMTENEYFAINISHALVVLQYRYIRDFIQALFACAILMIQQQLKHLESDVIVSHNHVLHRTWPFISALNGLWRQLEKK